MRINCVTWTRCAVGRRRLPPGVSHRTQELRVLKWHVLVGLGSSQVLRLKRPNGMASLRHLRNGRDEVRKVQLWRQLRCYPRRGLRIRRRRRRTRGRPWMHIRHTHLMDLWGVVVRKQLLGTSRAAPPSQWLCTARRSLPRLGLSVAKKLSDSATLRPHVDARHPARLASSPLRISRGPLTAPRTRFTSTTHPVCNAKHAQVLKEENKDK